MSDEIFEELAAVLKDDPNIAQALQDHEKACQTNEEDTCVSCNVRKGMRALLYVQSVIDDSEPCDCGACEGDPVTELDIAASLIDSMADGLKFIGGIQSVIKLLAELSQAASFIIYQNEIGDHDHDEDEED